MKIAIYAGMYKRNYDGATKTLYELTDSMLLRKIKVGIWAFCLTPQTRPGLSLYKVPSIPLFLYPDYKIAFPFPRLKKQLDAFQPDVIHIATPDLAGIFMVKYAKKNNIPIVMSYHTDFPSYLNSYKIGFLKKSVWNFFKWLYNQAGTVFVPTEEIQRDLAEKRITNTKIWSRGIHTELFNPSFRSNTLRDKWSAKGKKVILYSGRFVWYKDLQTFIDVYRLFKERGPEDIVFVLLGKGPIERELRATMPDAVFPGYLSGKQLGSAYASADVFLFPSTTETFGNVIQEALAAGIPTVVSDRGGCQEIVKSSGGGLIAKAKDAESFYQCCKQLLTKKNLYNRLRSIGLRYAKKKAWKRINDAVIFEYYRINKIPLASIVKDTTIGKGIRYIVFSLLWNIKEIHIKNKKA
jgi:glycosyltransferase involved in cell wall biosynthesis